MKNPTVILFWSSRHHHHHHNIIIIMMCSLLLRTTYNSMLLSHINAFPHHLPSFHQCNLSNFLLQLKLSETYEPLVPWFREAELRHGRTAMLAVIGFIATDFVRIPGSMYSFDAIPKTVDAHNILIEEGPMVQLLFWIGLFDLLITAPACAATMAGERDAGDFGWTKWAPKDKEGFDGKRASELLNGRLAMCAVGGIATQSVVTGNGFPYLFN
jgi:light-harvesting complex I chlorophyll a/b binding protein 1